MKRNLIILSLAMAVFACNNATQDVRPTIDFEIVTGANLPIIISPAQLTGDYSTGVDFNIPPEKGRVERVTNANFLRYTPNPDFAGGSDFFTADIRDSQGRIFGAGISVSVSDDECDFGPIFDHIQVRKGETVQIDLLANDIFCGGPANLRSGGISQHTLSTDFETSGLYDIASIHLNLPDDEVVMTITAPNTTGVHRIIYEVGIGIRLGSSGLIEGANVLDPEAYDTYMVSEATIEVID